MIAKSGTEALRGAYFGRGTGPIFLEFFQMHCMGSERDLLACASGVIGIHTCDHSQDAGVRCIGMVECNIIFIHIIILFDY